MKIKEKKIIIIVIILIFVLLIVKLLFSINSKNTKNENNQNQAENITANEEFVQILEDGTKLNTSTKMKETKIIDGLEISNIQLTEKDNISKLLGTITNNTTETKGDYPVKIIIYDKDGKEIVTVGGYIGIIKPGESKQLNSSATFDYANAYDYKIEKK